jgi:hypothetical protein
MILTKDQVIALLQEGNMDLVPTQDKLCFPIIKRLYSKMSNGLLMPSIQVDKNVIINGHHRYVASMLAEYPLERVKSITSAAKQQAEWKLVTIADEDWDSAFDIKMYNEEDAKYNELTFEDIIGIIT